MSFRDITPGKANKTYSPTPARTVPRPRMPDGDPSESQIDLVLVEMKNMDEKYDELKKMNQNLGTRVDNDQLRNEMKRAIRDLQGLQNKITEHLDEIEQFTKTKSKDRNVLKQLSELRRKKDLKARQIEELVNKSQTFMNQNPPQRMNQPAFLDTVEVEDKFSKINSSNANLQYNELLIRERHEDIMALSEEMGQVQMVFRDLADLINEQGQAVEDIESNVTSAAEQSKQGVRQVLLAKSKQKSSRNKCWTILTIIIVIVVAFVGLLLWYELGKKE